MRKKFKCKMPGCGEVSLDFSKTVILQIGSSSEASAYPCKKCGRYYWYDGDAVINRQGERLFERNGEAVLLRDSYVVVLGFSSETDKEQHKNEIWLGEATSTKDIDYYLKKFKIVAFQDPTTDDWITMEDTLKILSNRK